MKIVRRQRTKDALGELLIALIEFRGAQARGGMFHSWPRQRIPDNAISCFVALGMQDHSLVTLLHAHSVASKTSGTMFKTG